MRGGGAGHADRAQHPAWPGAVRHAAAAARFEPGYVLALQATVARRQRPQRRSRFGTSTAPPIGPLSRRRCKNFVGPPQNFVYADTAGTIGFIAARPHPDPQRNGDGWLPVPGWTGEYDWQGYIPFDELPQATQSRLGPFRQRQQQDRARQLSLFLSAATGTCPIVPSASRSCLRRHRGSRPKTSAAIQADTLSLMAPPAGAADDQASRRERTRRGQAIAAAAAHGTSAWMRDKVRAAAVHRLAARLCPRRAYRAGSAMRRPDYWDLRPRVIEAVLTERTDWCDSASDQAAETCEHAARRSAR